MTIQFECEQCGTVLKTSDDKAGKKARCPGCRAVIDIPAAGTSSAAAGPPAAGPPAASRRKQSHRDAWDDRGDDHADDYGDDYDEYGDESADESHDVDDRPRRRPRGGGASKSCPMCGERISPSATRCKYCGESLSERGRGDRASRGGFEAGEVISTAWEIFQKEWGTCLGAILLPLALQMALNFGTQLGMAVLAVAIQQAMGDAGIFVFFGLAIVWIVALALFGLYIQCGQAIVMVNVARNRSNGISDLFTGGPYMITLLLNGLVLGLAFIPAGLLIGVLAAFAEQLAVVGVIVLYGCVIVAALAIWPMTYALVDQNLSGLQPLTTAFRLTQGYRLSSLLLFLILGLLNVAGAFACGVGLLITIPLSMLSLAVAYCRLAGRKVHV